MKRICIDPGHGGADSGATGYGLKEKERNLAIALELKPMLGVMGHEVVMTRETDKRLGITATADLKARARKSVQSKADVFLSIHHDAGGQRGVHGFFYNEHCPNGGHLAGQVATEIAREWDVRFSYDKAASPHWNKLGVFRFSENWRWVTCALVECLFMSSKADTDIMRRADYARRTAFAIARGIQAHIRHEWPEDETPPPVEPALPDTPAGPRYFLLPEDVELKVVNSVDDAPPGKVFLRRLA